MIGDGEGTLEIVEDMFKRTCKCGQVVEVKENQMKGLVHHAPDF